MAVALWAGAGSSRSSTSSRAYRTAAGVVGDFEGPVAGEALALEPRQVPFGPECAGEGGGTGCD